jgi:hypothetical protein
MRLAKEGFSVDAAIAKGRELPEWFLEEPDLPPGGQFFFQAFQDLSTGRQWGEHPGPISWQSIVAYAAYHSLDESATDVLLNVIRTMDNAYLDWLGEQIKKAQAKSK